MSNPETFKSFYDKWEREHRLGNVAINGFSNEMFSAKTQETQEELEMKARRLEQLESNEKAKTTIADFVKKAAAKAIIATAIVGAVVAGGLPTKEIMDTNQARYVREFQVESITIHGGPNLRSNPSVANGEMNNVLIDLGDEEQIINSSYQGVAYYYDSGSDANGAWVGVPADAFADALYEGSFISRRDASKIKDHEGETDNVLWMSEKYVNYEKAE